MQLAYIRQLFRAISLHDDDRIALCIIDDAKKVSHRFVEAGNIERYLPFLRYSNANGSDIYFTPSILNDGARTRKKESFKESQSVVFLEFDDPVAFDRLVSERKYPYPSAIVSSSEGHFHVYWLLDKPLSVKRQEELIWNVARSSGADRASTDVSRVLRLPGFRNNKPDRNNHICQLVFPSLRSTNYNVTSFDELVSPISVYEKRDRGSSPASASLRTCDDHRGFRKGADMSRSGEDWHLVHALLDQGDEPLEVVEWLFGHRQDKPNPKYYALHTVRKALELRGDDRYLQLDFTGGNGNARS